MDRVYLACGSTDLRKSIDGDVYGKVGKCAFTVNPESLVGRASYGGLDLSSTTDITAFILIFPPEYEGDKYIILPYFWIPEDNLDQRVKRDHVPYDVWEKQGFYAVEIITPLAFMTREGYCFFEKFISPLDVYVVTIYYVCSNDIPYM